jgi:hypothetical protein
MKAHRGQLWKGKQNKNSKEKMKETAMEQHVPYIFIYYRGHLLKGAAIFYATGTNLHQQNLFNEENVYYEHCHFV